METPLISVIMSVYNTNYDYLSNSIASILNQTYKNFEFIIVDDASTNNIERMIKDFGDSRIIFRENEHNLGLTKSLNKAIKISSGKYIARMDADDISSIDRFDKQIRFLENNPQVGVLGSQAVAIGEKKHPINQPTSHEQIKAKLILNSAIIHPSVMIKSSLLKKNMYNEKFKKGQDYELWSRLIWKTQFHNLEGYLLNYRIHSQQITRRDKTSQRSTASIVREKMLKKINDEITKENLNLFHYSITGNIAGKDKIIQLKKYSESLIRENTITNNFSEKDLIYVFSENLDRAIFFNGRKHGNLIINNIKLEPKHIKNNFSIKKKWGFAYFLIDKILKYF